MLECLIEVELPSLVNCVLCDVEEIESILFVDQPIREHSEHLMHPDPAGLLLIL
jgi:hypothetical protein